MLRDEHVELGIGSQKIKHRVGYSVSTARNKVCYSVSNMYSWFLDVHAAMLRDEHIESGIGSQT